MGKITFRKQSDFGLKTDELNVYSNKRIIGYCRPEHKLKAKNHDFTYLTPIQDWDLNFSPALKRRMLADLKARPLNERLSFPPRLFAAIDKA